ncbi:SUMF1/EgtB/PvdO family nonheme iron enzyme [Massilia aurea]|uniref:SUMF1/EgtB/PvdO family nonheme iron enzyme n=1 Tax=Massilia aurea TaxID=373040 RepID=UPI00346309A3
MGAIALATVALARTVPATPPLAPLGNPSLCAAGSGLPPGWGQQPHAGMVHVAGGDFVFGSAVGYPDEQPATPERQRVAGFWIDQTEVTNAQFAAFVRATGYVTEAERQGAAVVFHTPDTDELQRRPYAWWRYARGASWKDPQGPAAPAPNAPVTLVTQADALAYARWLGRDLPTEAEWEYAAKAGRSDAGLDSAPVDAHGRPDANYWQGPFPLADAAEDGHAGLAPVGCYRANAFKLHDMIGNAWEWTKDGYTGPRQPHMNGDTAAVAASATGRTVARAPNQPMVIKGGSFLCAPSYCMRYRASAREAQEADLGASHIGFRTVQRGS